jgi:hypothetical protein
MDPIINNYNSKPFDELLHCEKEGIMYQADMTQSVSYDVDYYEKYVKYENTEISLKLNQGRKQITEKYCKSILDIGIGSGEFIKNSQIKAFGFDINPIAIKWLQERNLFVDLDGEIPNVDGFTFWDSLEHIPNPYSILSLLKKNQYAFISMPIFQNLIELKGSKHYRPNEHYYYFNINGMTKYMTDLDFSLIETNDFESKAGRQDILTFVFRKN